MMKTCQAARGLTLALSGTAAALYGVVVSMKGQHPNNRLAWSCLPLVGLGFSAIWSFLSLMTLCSGATFFFPRRLHLFSDLSAALALVILGYLSLVYNVIAAQQNPHRHGRRHHKEDQLQAGGIALLTLAAASHLIFFCYNSRKGAEEEQADDVETAAAAPPAYVDGGENPFEDARSVRSLPQYEAGDFEDVDLEKKKKKKKKMSVSEEEVEEDAA
ncbi:hypothetical protein MBLNU459_g1742t1 [Dothideomycetes sp. NU459]